MATVTLPGKKEGHKVKVTKEYTLGQLRFCRFRLIGPRGNILIDKSRCSDLFGTLTEKELANLIAEHAAEK
jgi:hypothetical protein